MAAHAEQNSTSIDVKQDIPNTKHDISCSDRALMVLWPCKYLNEPKVATNDYCLCGHEASLYGITIPPLIELAGTYIGDDPIPKWFIYLRTTISVLMIYILLFGFIRYAIRGFAEYYWIYFTMWVQTLCAISMLVKTYATFKIYNKFNENRDGLLKSITHEDRFWRLYIWNSVLVQMSVPTTGMVALNYFAFVCPWSWSSPGAFLAAIQLHGINMILIWLDFYLSAQQMYYKAAFWSIMLGTVYTMWTIIFEIFINLNESGDPYIYSIYNWSESISTPIMYYFLSVALLTGFTAIITLTKNVLLIRAYVTNSAEKTVTTSI